MFSWFRMFLFDERTATKSLKIASVAMTCDSEPEINLLRIINTVDTILQECLDVELVIFGEMILGWYNPSDSPDYLQHISESIPGETTQALAAMAKRHQIYLCFGISELDGKKLYNSQVLLNPEGEIQVVHRKCNLKQGEKDAGYLPGSTLVTLTDIKGIKTGLVICSDAANPPTVWQLMKSRLDFIILSLADDDEDDFASRFHARMYDAWVVTANRFGKEENWFWPGLIGVSDPLGELRITKLGEEQYLVYELRFPETRSWLKRVIRNVCVKTPVIFHVLKSWRRLRAYL